jgi:hypothetical protein
VRDLLVDARRGKEPHEAGGAVTRISETGTNPRRNFYHVNASDQLGLIFDDVKNVGMI